MASDKPSLEGLRIDRAEDEEDGRRAAAVDRRAGRGAGRRGRGLVARRGRRPVPVRTAAARRARGARPRPERCSTPRATSPPAGRRPSPRRSPARWWTCWWRRGWRSARGRCSPTSTTRPRARQLALAEAQLASQRRAPRREPRCGCGRRSSARTGCGACRSRGSRPRPTSTPPTPTPTRSRRGSTSAGRTSQVAERQVALRRQDVDDTVIRAPFSGVAVSKDAQPGEMISPDLGRRRLHPHRHLHAGGHEVAGDRGGRQRELHPPGDGRASGRWRRSTPIPTGRSRRT